MTLITVLIRLLARLTNLNNNVSRFALILAMLLVASLVQEPAHAGWCKRC